MLLSLLHQNTVLLALSVIGLLFISVDRKELDKVQNRLSKMYDDKLDGVIDDELYHQKFKEMKIRQQEIMSKMQKHVKADEAFHITANTVLNLASRARQLFESSEVDEKRQLLNFVFQNLALEGEKLAHTLREPFSLIMNMKACPSGWGNWTRTNEVVRRGIYSQPKSNMNQSASTRNNLYMNRL